MNMTINVNVNLDVTPRLEELIRGLLKPQTVAPTMDDVARAMMAIELEQARRGNRDANNVRTEVEEPHTDEPTQEPHTDEPTQEPQTIEEPSPEPPTAEEEPAPVDDLPWEEPIRPSEPQPQPEPTTIPSTDPEYVRSAMKEVRNRIEGPGWEQNTTTEAYRKYHGPLTRIFKQIAMQIGGTKPTELPGPDYRERFAEEISQIKVREDGELVTPEAPY